MPIPVPNGRGLRLIATRAERPMPGAIYYQTRRIYY